MYARTALHLVVAVAVHAHAGPASAAGSGPTAALSQAAPIPARADGADIYADAPPPSSYDRTGEMPGVTETLRQHSSGLLSQLVRTVVALLGVLALLTVCGKIIAPRLLRGLNGVGRGGNRGGTGLTVTDRLVLDGRNTLVQVQLAHGPRYLIACGDHGTTLVDRLPAPGDASTAPAPSFADHMGTRPTSKE